MNDENFTPEVIDCNEGAFPRNRAAYEGIGQEDVYGGGGGKGKPEAAADAKKAEAAIARAAAADAKKAEAAKAVAKADIGTEEPTKPREALLTMQKALQQGEKEWGRSKIMIVGEGQAGKTAVANSIVGTPFTETSSTVGINQLSCRQPSSPR